MFMRSSIVNSDPILPRRPMVVVISCRCGTLLIVTVSSVNNVAARIGKAAFLAPEMLISPCMGKPPWIISLSTGRSTLGNQHPQFPLSLPFTRGQGLHGKGMDLLTHAVAKRAVYQLMTPDSAFACKQFTDDYRLEMAAIPLDILHGFR